MSSPAGTIVRGGATIPVPVELTRETFGMDSVELVDQLPDDRATVEPAARLNRLVELERLIANLVGDAARHSPVGRKVLSTAGAHAGRVEVRVVDSSTAAPGRPRAAATVSSSPSSGSATPTTPPDSASGRPPPGA